MACPNQRPRPVCSDCNGTGLYDGSLEYYCWCRQGSIRARQDQWQVYQQQAELMFGPFDKEKSDEPVPDED